jgi:hypothetical protein
MSERTGSQAPPLEPILIPDSPLDQENRTHAKPESKRRPEPVAMVQKPPKAKKPRRTKIAVPLFTLEDAFDFFSVSPGGERTDSEFQNERCVRAVAFLLHYCSEYGNEAMEGSAAHGLGLVLQKCAGNIAYAVAHHDWVREAESSKRQN